MVDGSLQYEAMVERALRGVMREALAFAAERGMPGEHHFYITFRTEHPGVAIPDYLRERYPSEMTIVLEHRFWSLEVGDEIFGVTLSFADVPERLTVPYEAVTAFFDPSVRFGLQFDGGKAAASDKPEEVRMAEIATLPVGQAARKANSGEDKAAKTAAGPVPGAAEPASNADAKPAAAGSAEDGPDKIVTLDKFRKS